MQMTVEQLNKHISDVVMTSVKEHVAPVVAEQIQKSMETALKPAGDGKTVAQAEAEATKAALKGAAEGKSQLSTKKKERQKGESLGAIVRALKISRNDIGGACSVLKRDGDEDLADLMQSQAKWVDGGQNEKAMMAGDQDTGGVLIPLPVSQEVADVLRARLAVSVMGATVVPMPSGNYRLPKVTSGVQGYYVGESTAGTTEAVKTGSVLLSYKKLVATIPASNDLFRYSSPGANQLISQQVVNGLAVRKDQAFLRGTGDNGTPKGLRYWCKSDNLISASGSNGIALYATTLGNLILKLMQGNCPMVRPGWIFSPQTYMALMMVRSTTGDFILRPELAAGTLFGYRYMVSTQVPQNLTDGGGTTETEIYLADFGDVVIGEAQQLAIVASDVAAYEEGGSVKAAFSRDETVIRAIDEHDMVVLRDACLAVANKCTWVMA